MFYYCYYWFIHFNPCVSLPLCVCPFQLCLNNSICPPERPSNVFNAYSHNIFLWSWVRLSLTTLAYMITYSVTICSTSVACVVDRVSCRLQMYVECTVYLCVTTRPSQKCPDQCDRASSNQVMVDNVLTRSYTVRSGPVSLVPTTAALATTTVVPATTPTGTISATAAPTTTASNGRICKLSCSFNLSLGALARQYSNR